MSIKSEVSHPDRAVQLRGLRKLVDSNEALKREVLSLTSRVDRLETAIAQLRDRPPPAPRDEAEVSPRRRRLIPGADRG